MEWFIKAALAAGAVLLVSAAARRGGPRLAGIVAALPTITAPTLAWLAYEHGVVFATRAAVASIASCAVLAAFGLGYAWAARRSGVVVSLCCSVVSAGALALPAFEASATLADSLTMAVACAVLAFAAMPAHGIPVRVSRPTTRRSLLTIAGVTGGATALAATIGPALGSFATGLLASLPLISGAVAMIEHATGGPQAATQFLRGYVWGLFGKTVFGLVFALSAVRIGVPAALGLGCMMAGVLSWLGTGPRRGRSAHTASPSAA